MDDEKNEPIPQSICDLKLIGNIDTTYLTQQHNLFRSGLAAKIGVNAQAVLNVIKSHADFKTGKSRPGIRRISLYTGLSMNPVQDALRRLEKFNLLRITKRTGLTNVYMARECLEILRDEKVVCFVVLDYIPLQLRQRLKLLKRAALGESEGVNVWDGVEIITVPGKVFDAKSRTFKRELDVAEVTGGKKTTAPVSGRQRVREELKKWLPKSNQTPKSS